MTHGPKSHETTSGTGGHQGAMHRVQESAGQLKTDVKHGVQSAASAVAAEVKHSVPQITEDVHQLAQHAGTAVGTGLTSAKETVQRGVEDAKEKAVAATDSFKETISGRPLTSIGVALGVGFLLGAFVFRVRE